MSETEFKDGELIENRYRVLSVVGSGGMGTLYRVSDEARGGEVVALKTVRLDVPMVETTESVKRFQHEFQILTQLRHPNLVSVYDYGITTEDGLYFTMEWVQGQSLNPGERLLEPGATIPVIVQICRALAYLHARGVIHGDLKPSNVLVTDDADDLGHRVKIVDFGVALEMRTPELRARYYTPGYTAPEVKEQRTVDHRVDLYSLGAMWYALLTGEPPQFMAGSERLIQFTLEETLEAQDQVPLQIGDVIVRLLAASPEERYASANEAIEAVNEAVGSTYALETRETASSYALRVRFVDREAEIEMLQTAWKQARSSEGKLVLVGGEGGVGKTRLLEELIVQAELEGAWVARGQCVESGGVAYRPWREVLRVLMRYVEGAHERREGPGLEMERVGPVLAMLLPELWERDYMAGLVPPADLEPQAAQQRLNDAVAEVLQAAARLRPSVIVIEDAHWADEATLSLLGLLARIPGRGGLLVCVTYRDDAIDSDHLLARLTGRRVERIRVHSLSPEFTTDLVRSMLGLQELPALLTERVQQTTGGNAFFVQELIRSLAENGEVLQRTVDGWKVDHKALQEARLPESIRQVVWQRLEQLSPETQQVLRWAAIVGPVFWDGVLGEVGQVSGEWVQAALVEALEQELIFERDTTAFEQQREYKFSSPATRQMSYESLLWNERRKAHDRVAEWLMAHSDGEDGEYLGLIGDHLERAGRIEEAVAYLTQAGEQAMAQFANAEAVAYFSRALDLIGRQDHTTRYSLLLARERAYDLQGTREAQFQDLVALKELAALLDGDVPSETGESRQSEVALRLAQHAEVTGDYPEAIAASQEAIRLAKAARDVSGEAAGHVRWGFALWRQGKFEDARLQLEQAISLAREAVASAGSAGFTGAWVEPLLRVEADGLNNLGTVCNFQGDPVGARTHKQQALSIYREIGHRQGEGIALIHLGLISVHRGDYAEARSFYEQALSICREIGHRRNLGLALGNLAEVLAHLGDYTGAKSRYEQALLIRREVGDREGESVVLGELGLVYLYLGNYDRSRTCVEQALLICREIGDRGGESYRLCDLSLLFHLLGDNERALEHGQQAMSILEGVGDLRIQGNALTNLGHALVALGDLQGAGESYQRALTLRRDLGQLHLAVESLAGLARVSLAQGDLSQAQAWVDEILGYLEDHTLHGTYEPFRVYLTCHRVLRANEDPRTEAVLKTAYDLLQERAAKITDEHLRRSFLEKVSAHREIVVAWERE